jgi:hypothetical protein
METWSSALETISTEFETSIERILKSFDKALGDLEYKLD